MIITWEQIGIFSIFFIMICVAVTCVYLVRLIAGIHDSVKMVNGMLKENRNNINKTLQDMPVVYENLVDISQAAKDKMKEVENVIDNINETAELTAATANTIKNDILGKAKNVMDIVYLLMKLIFYNKDVDDNKKGQQTR